GDDQPAAPGVPPPAALLVGTPSLLRSGKSLNPKVLSQWHEPTAKSGAIPVLSRNCDGPRSCFAGRARSPRIVPTPPASGVGVRRPWPRSRRRPIATPAPHD